MRNITKTGYEALTIIRSLNDPTIGFGLDISPVLWINECKDTKFFVFAPQGCINQIYELSSALNDYIDGIITPCGNILPINNKVEFLDSEGIGLECVEGKLKFVIKAPLDPSLGGTGFITYNDGDILVGNQDGKLSILLKGEIGQVLGVKPDGTVGFITSSASEGINEIITPCGRLNPIDGAIKLTIGEGLEATCTSNELTTKLKVPVTSNLGGTGLQQYNKGDVLVGKEDGTLEKLGKGAIGQVLGIDSNGNLSYITPSVVPGTNKVVMAFARFPWGQRATWRTNNFYVVGGEGGITFIKLRDQDGDNFQANNLILGNGTLNNYLHYVCPYDGVVAVNYRFTMEVNNLDKLTYLQTWTCCLGDGEPYESYRRTARFDTFTNYTRKTTYATDLIPVQKKDSLFVAINVSREPSDPSLTASMYSFWGGDEGRVCDSCISFTYTQFGNTKIPTMEES